MALAVAVATPAAAQVIDDPIPRTIPERRAIGLETIATGLSAPNWGTSAPGQPRLLFVTDQVGIVWKVDLVTRERTSFLDAGDAIPAVPLTSTGERGLLGIAFHPHYAENGLFYTYTSETAAGPSAADFPPPANAATDHDTVVSEWQVIDPADPDATADPGSRRVLVRIGQPQGNHNGGALAFLPDETLLIALGDGGGRNDQGPGHSPGGNAQDPSNVQGAMLRIDPLGRDSLNGEYGVPADNPFHPGGTGPFGGQAGCDADDLCDEIYADGFRNLFRLSVDRQTGVVIGGDVGQGDIEEVNRIRPGRNYGWPVLEGSFCLVPDEGVSDRTECDAPEGAVFPLAQYDHDEGVSVIGGFLYRGTRIQWLAGRYVFGDFIGADRQGGRLFYLGQPNTEGNRVRRPIFAFRIDGRESLGYRLLGFGEDSAGELYVLGSGNGGGIVERIVRARQ